MPSDSDKLQTMQSNPDIPLDRDVGSSYSRDLNEIGGLLERTQDPTQLEAKRLAFHEK
jgi:hypothetical protein